MPILSDKFRALSRLAEIRNEISKKNAIDLLINSGTATDLDTYINSFYQDGTAPDEEMFLQNLNISPDTAWEEGAIGNTSHLLQFGHNSSMVTGMFLYAGGVVATAGTGYNMIRDGYIASISVIVDDPIASGTTTFITYINDSPTVSGIVILNTSSRSNIATLVASGTTFSSSDYLGVYVSGTAVARPLVTVEAILSA